MEKSEKSSRMRCYYNLILHIVCEFHKDRTVNEEITLNVVFFSIYRFFCAKWTSDLESRGKNTSIKKNFFICG